MKSRWLIIGLLLKLILSIKFDYVAAQHQFICFHENVEKETRYQVVVKAEKSTYALQMFQEDVCIYDDIRSNIFIKQYSAFSKANGLLSLCLTNNDLQQPITYEIEFYHGLHLDGYSTDDSKAQLQEIMAQTFEMQSFVKMAYQMNVKTLTERNQIISSMGTIISLATIFFFIMLGFSRILLISKLKKLLRKKKMI